MSTPPKAPMRPLIKTLIALPALALAAYSAGCVALAYGARSMLYHPVARHAAADSWPLQRGDTQLVVSSNLKGGEEAVVYYGGNAEDVSGAIAELERAYPTAAIHALHYRGYGGSQGEPTEENLIADGLALYDAVARQHPHITLIGRSLGTGIATQVAAQRKTQRLVLITPYNSILELGQAHFPWFPVRWLLRDHYDSWRYAGRVSAPTTLLIAGRDQVTPPQSGYALSQHFPSGIAQVISFPDADHSTISQQPGYLQALRGERTRLESPVLP